MIRTSWRWFDSRAWSFRLPGNQIVCRHFGGCSRVFRKDAPILVLIEATPAPDSDFKAIEESFHALMTNRTVIVITHRLSAIAAPDGFLARVWDRKPGGFLHHQHRLAGSRPAQ